MKHAAPLLLAGLLVLAAGCGGNPTATTTTVGPTGTSPEDTGTVRTPATPVPQTSTTPRTTRIKEIDGLELPPGFTAEGVVPGEEIVSTHMGLISNISHTVSYVQYNSSTSGTLEVEPNASTAYIDYTIDGFDLEIYTNNGSGTRRFVTDGGEERLRDVNVSIRQMQSTLVLPAFVGTYRAATYTHAGTTTYEGLDVHRYEVTGLADDRIALNASNATDVSGYLLVDERGLIVDYQLSFTYEGQQRMYQYTLTDIGSTSVSEPSWAS